MKYVLVVDDDPSVSQGLSRLLRQSGYEVATANTGLEALAMVHGRRPDVVVLDVILPDYNGFELLEQFRLRDMSDVAIVVLSGLLRPLSGMGLISLVKPVTIEELSAAIERAYGELR